MNEFTLINKYLRPLTIKNPSSLNLSDDIYFDKTKKLAISIDTYVEGVHFIKSLNPKYFLRKILRSSLSDLYCKGINPKSYFMSLSLKRSLVTDGWLKKMKNILNSEQEKFKITLAGGDTTISLKTTITFAILGYSNNTPIFRNFSKSGNDIYVTGNLGDSYIGLSILKGKYNFKKFNNYFVQRYYKPSLPIKISNHLYKIANSSIDISDGLVQDLKHICTTSKCGAHINLNLLPFSKPTKSLILKNKLNIKKIFSNGDDYQILFTSNKKKRLIINKLSKKLNLKITRIGTITKERNITLEHDAKNVRLNEENWGYIHNF